MLMAGDGHGAAMFFICTYEWTFRDAPEGSPDHEKWLEWRAMLQQEKLNIFHLMRWAECIICM